MRLRHRKNGIGDTESGSYCDGQADVDCFVLFQAPAQECQQRAEGSML